MISILPLTMRHCEALARLHMEGLHTRFSGQPGRHLLTHYYAAMVEQQGACGYVAEASGDIAGFVCGVWAPEMVRSALLRAAAPQMVFWGACQALCAPGIVATLVLPGQHRCVYTSGSEPASHYELRPIVVASGFRGQGVGRQLVRVLIDDAGRRGNSSLFLVTEQDNTAAHRLYQTLGFLPTATLVRAGQTYVQYERATTGAK